MNQLLTSKSFGSLNTRGKGPICNTTKIILFSVGIILSGCSQKQKSEKFELNFEKIETDSTYSRVWGIENIFINEDGNLIVHYPKGSFAPSGGIRGGAGFLRALPEKSDHMKLNYTIEFPENFQFAKGGKLPGICGGNCPSGGDDALNGFSSRFMWRSGGMLELYIYSYDKSGKYGESYTNKSFSFQPGKKYKLTMELELNDVGENNVKNNGKIAYYINDKLIYLHKAVSFRKFQDINIDTFMFSTFFGGSNSSWATPIDTQVTFGDFSVEVYK